MRKTHASQIPNVYTVGRDYTRMKITRRDGMNFVVKIDHEDVVKVKRHHWRILVGKAKGYYVIAGEDNDRILLHRLITCPPDEKKVGFLNRDHLDCRKSNLLVSNSLELHQDKLHPRSVRRTSTCSKWHYIFYFRKQRYYQGGFLTAEECQEACEKLKGMIKENRKNIVSKQIEQRLKNNLVQ